MGTDEIECIESIKGILKDFKGKQSSVEMQHDKSEWLKLNDINNK